LIIFRVLGQRPPNSKNLEVNQVKTTNVGLIGSKRSTALTSVWQIQLRFNRIALFFERRSGTINLWLGVKFPNGTTWNQTIATILLLKDAASMSLQRMMEFTAEIADNIGGLCEFT
jgi:hypothetical protein